MIRLSRIHLPVVALLVCACSRDKGLVARAGDQSWTVDEAATLLASAPNVPPRREAVGAVANLWIDYTLLASAVAKDTTLAQVDVTPLVNDLIADQLIMALRDTVITVKPISTQDLLARYRSEAPGSAVRARQILLTWPDSATDVQKDSVRKAIQALRSRIVQGGDSFATVAREYSKDSGSAANGGELGTVVRGQLVAPLDSALFSLAPGQVSEPVASPYGLHLLQVEERMLPTVAQFRANLMSRREAEAESLYVSGLEAEVDPEIVEGAPARVRELARNIRTPLTAREARRPLLRYKGGQVSEGAMLWYLQKLPPATRNQVAASHDSSIAERMLRAVEHRQLLVAAAVRRGWGVQPDAREQLAQRVRRNLADAARQLGLLPIVVSPGQGPAEAVQAAVAELLSDMLSGKRTEVTPLGVMSYVLRRQYPARVVEPGVEEVAARVGELRRGRDAGVQDTTSDR
jgi:hypothetical protein